MEWVTVEALRESPEVLVRRAEEGKLSLVADAEKPIFVALPFEEALVRYGVRFALATKLYEEGGISLGAAATLAGMGRVEFMNCLGRLHIPVIRYSPQELERELQGVELLLPGTDS